MQKRNEIMKRIEEGGGEILSLFQSGKSLFCGIVNLRETLKRDTRSSTNLCLPLNQDVVLIVCEMNNYQYTVGLSRDRRS